MDRSSSPARRRLDDERSKRGSPEPAQNSKASLRGGELSRVRRDQDATRGPCGFTAFAGHHWPSCVRPSRADRRRRRDRGLWLRRSTAGIRPTVGQRRRAAPFGRTRAFRPRQTGGRVSRAGSGTSQPGACASQARSGTSQPGACASQAGSGTSQPGACVSQAGSGTSQPGACVSQAGSGTSESRSCMSQSD
jgi:hypothetical protein